MKSVIYLAMFILVIASPELFAQVTTNSSGDSGFVAYFKNVEGQALNFVTFIMVAFGCVGAVTAYFAVMTIRDNLSDNPGSGKPEWGKCLGQLVFAGATIGGAGWIWSVTTALNGNTVDEGAASKVRDRYKGTGN